MLVWGVQILHVTCIPASSYTMVTKCVDKKQTCMGQNVKVLLYRLRLVQHMLHKTGMVHKYSLENSCGCKIWLGES